MSAQCEFCVRTVPKNKAVLVKELMIYKNPGLVKFSEILFDIFGGKFAEQAELICENCLTSCTDFFQLKQKVRQKLKIEDTNGKIVLKFLIETSEEVTVIEHHSCLSLVPASKVNLMKNFIYFNPLVDVGKSVQRQEENENESTAISEASIDEMESQFELIRDPETPAAEVHPVQEASNVKLDFEMDEEENLLEEVKAKPEPTSVVQSNDESTKEVTKKRKIKAEPETVESVKVDINDDGSSKYKFGANQSNLKPELSQSSIANYYQMTTLQEKWLKQQVIAARIFPNFFECQQCRKNLRSYAAIRYHIYSKHVIPQDADKTWVANKIRESKKISESKDGRKFTTWHCVKCSYVSPSAPGIRYHYHKHLTEASSDDDSI